MSLADAQPRAPLPPGPPYDTRRLHAWAGLDFVLPAGDPRLLALHDGAPEPSPPLANLAGASVAWRDWPAHMDFLDPDSPNRSMKQLELALYLDRWAPHVPEGCRVLDLGGGIGRFTTWCLDRRCDVELVDPDLRSLRRALAHALDRPGRLDLHWTTGERLPDLAPVDVVIAAEVLCYVEDPAAVLDGLRRRLRPDGVLLLSVEARWGWAMAMDVPPRSLDALLRGDGVVHVPGDRWVRTFERDDLAALLRGWRLEEIVATHYTSSGPLEGAAAGLSTAEVVAAEARLRAHPTLGPLNRAWTVIARP